MCSLLLIIVFLLVIFAFSGDKATLVKKKEEWVLLHQEKDACEKDTSTSSETQKSGSNKGMNKRKSKDDKVKHGLI